MIAVLETDDVVRLNFLKAVLEDADLHPFIFDNHSAYRQLPIRLVVPEGEAELARLLIAEVDREA